MRQRHLAVNALHVNGRCAIKAKNLKKINFLSIFPFPAWRVITVNCSTCLFWSTQNATLAKCENRPPPLHSYLPRPIPLSLSLSLPFHLWLRLLKSLRCSFRRNVCMLLATKNQPHLPPPPPFAGALQRGSLAFHVAIHLVFEINFELRAF